MNNLLLYHVLVLQFYKLFKLEIMYFARVYYGEDMILTFCLHFILLKTNIIYKIDII